MQEQQKKFRSISAFKNYRKGESSQEISPTRILALIKHAGGSMEKGRIARELDAGMDVVSEALVPLLQDGLVTVEPGPDQDASKDVVRL